MRIESMIELAKECGSEKELERASSQFRKEIERSDIGKKMQCLDFEYEISPEEGAFFSFEYVREISNRYIIRLYIEISDGEIQCMVFTDRCLDDAGFASHSWGSIDEEEIMARGHEDLDSMLAVAKAGAINAQINLLQYAGASYQDACNIADKNW